MNAFHKLLGGAALALVLAAGLAAPAMAQKLDNKKNAPPAATASTSGDIDFGDDSSQWSNDGECDDPRFTGAGSASELLDADILKDATDCRAAFEAGTVTLKEGGATTTATATTATTPTIDFGDDSSEWAKDGECDDPRFTGTGSAAETVDADLLKDATDCKAAFDAGTVTLKDGGTSTTATTTTTAAIDFGDDSGEWANDGECDDPRFTGTGSAAETVDADIRKDATDCKTAFDAGTVTLFSGDAPAVAADIDFGDDSSEWANDGECDDPRFVGAGSAAETVDIDISKDATDCKAAFDAGTVTLAGGEIPAAAIDYGDDTSEWAKDGECDDPRFSGTGVAGELLDADRGHDATDCRAAVTAGTATYNGETPVATAVPEFDYGSDFSKWANDGECDDLRFMGEGTDKKLLTDDLYGDATDCKALEAEGRVTIRKVYSPAYIAGAPYDSSHVDFGDNTSDYANDDRCDDPRFEGPGAASVLLESDQNHDSEDCKAAYEAGTIILISEAEEGM